MKLNECKIIGFLVRDAETVMLKSGRLKQAFRIAINDDYQNKSTGENVHRVHFVDCYVIGKEYKGMSKGRRILINGKLVSKEYETNKIKKGWIGVEAYTLDFMYQKPNGEEEPIPAEIVQDMKDTNTDEVPF